jgi:hypothetical protein
MQNNVWRGVNSTGNQALKKPFQYILTGYFR